MQSAPLPLNHAPSNRVVRLFLLEVRGVTQSHAPPSPPHTRWSDPAHTRAVVSSQPYHPTAPPPLPGGAAVISPSVSAIFHGDAGSVLALGSVALAGAHTLTARRHTHKKLGRRAGAGPELWSAPAARQPAERGGVFVVPHGGPGLVRAGPGDRGVDRRTADGWSEDDAEVRGKRGQRGRGVEYQSRELQGSPREKFSPNRLVDSSSAMKMLMLMRSCLNWIFDAGLSFAARKREKSNVGYTFINLHRFIGRSRIYIMSRNSIPTTA